MRALHKASAYTAIVFAIFLAIAEAYRNWGDWQWWPWWLIDYICSAMLLAGAAVYLCTKDRAFLAGAWGITVSIFYASGFSHIESMAASGPQTTQSGVGEELLTATIFAMMAVAAAGLLASALPERRG
ncbi:MAG: hypothetical protein AAF830_08225 [Pseudomonadota bacterium]